MSKLSNHIDCLTCLVSPKRELLWISGTGLHRSDALPVAEKKQCQSTEGYEKCNLQKLLFSWKRLNTKYSTVNHYVFLITSKNCINLSLSAEK